MDRKLDRAVQCRAWRERLARLALFLLMIGLFAAGFAVFMQSRQVKGGIAASGEVILSVAGGVLLTMLGTLVCSLLYFRRIADSLVDRLLFPRNYLKEAPLLLSPLRGRIAAGDYAGAREELEALRERYPATPEIVSLLAELYADRLGMLEAACRVMEAYFRRPRRPEAPENLEMLLRYDDLCRERGEGGMSAILLQRESAGKIYSSPERERIRQRLAAGNGGNA